MSTACRVLQPTKNPFMDTLRAVIQDVKWFLFLLVLTVWGFTCAFYILFRKDQQYEVVAFLFTLVFTTLVALALNWKVEHDERMFPACTISAGQVVRS